MVSIVPKATGLTSAEEGKKSLGNLRTAVLVEGSSKMLGCWNQGGTEGEQAEMSSVDC